MRYMASVWLLYIINHGYNLMSTDKLVKYAPDMFFLFCMIHIDDVSSIILFFPAYNLDNSET